MLGAANSLAVHWMADVEFQYQYQGDTKALSCVGVLSDMSIPISNAAVVRNVVGRFCVPLGGVGVNTSGRGRATRC
jgi:hypothetical protein